MQNNAQYIYLYFTKDDQDLLAWANMIKKNNLNLSTWVQGVLVAETAKANLDIGAIQIPPHAQPTPKQIQTNSNLFGDDTGKHISTVTGWDIRGENGSLIPGSILPIKITRPVALAALNETKRQHKKTGAYIKALIRQNLEILPTGPDQPPKKTDVIDLFVLCEDKIGRNNYNNQQKKNKNSQPAQQQEGQQQPELAPKTAIQKTLQQKRTGDNSLQKNKKKENTQIQENQPPKRGNPLLNQIS